jgi:DNA polymerase III subunit gamma/tau
MGSVPNAIFERLLEAVAASQSAELMQQLNVLVNAGHSPLTLARQMARYLRNTLMAKLGGEQTDLLQISADERARAARTALLFNEEELTRNLQIVLRTFDDLNYRQEQRFHLELGLLKLIHAQRLLPIEELLSGMAGGAARNSSGSAPRASASSARPFKTFENASPFRTNETAPAAALEISHFPPVASQTAGYASPAELTEGALAKAPEVDTAVANTLSTDHVREAIVAALATAGHSSAAQLLGAGQWKLDGATVRVVAPGLGKKMLSLTVNAAAEKIVRQELQRLGAPARFMVTPGAGVAATAVAAPLAPVGSVQEAALAHPLVKRAQEIFKAEVRSVVDLRQK